MPLLQLLQKSGPTIVLGVCHYPFTARLSLIGALQLFHSKFPLMCYTPQETYLNTQSPRWAEVHLQLGFALCPPCLALNPNAYVAANSMHASFRNPVWRSHVSDAVNLSRSIVPRPLTSGRLVASRGGMLRSPCYRHCKELKEISISFERSVGYTAKY